MSLIRLHPALRSAPDAVAVAALWPAPARVMRSRGVAGAGAIGKAWFRDWLSRPHRALLLATLNQHPAWHRLFARDPRYAHCVMSHFIDRRHGVPERFSAMAVDLQAAAAAFGTRIAERIIEREPIRLWSLGPDVHLCLGLNDVSYHEGLWALSLRDASGARLYYLSFCFRAGRELIVPTLQGPGGPGDAARDTIRRITKDAEGLRPPALLMAALRTLCALWGIERLSGIAPEHHVKGRWNLRGTRLRFDYRGFWQEQGGRPCTSGHWNLPLAPAPRPLQDVPANKRAMYRRRHAMLQVMNGQIAEAFGVPDPARLAAA